MMIGLKLTVAVLGATLLMAAAAAETNAWAADLSALGLTCEYAVDPLGVDAAQPRFGWVLESDARGQAQSAYQILVAGSEAKLGANAGDKWDSGKVNSDRSVNVEYQGKTLASGEKCYWKVRVWDKQGQPSTWSQPGRFEMGLMEQSDWQGQWIGSAPPSRPAEQQTAAKSDRINVALAAKPSTSFVSGHETLDAINDDFEPANSRDKKYGAYGNWAHRGTQWVQYEWSKPVNTAKIDVYWWDDRAGVRLPKASRLLYWDGKAFIPVKNPVGLGVEGNKYNATTFEEITTSKLKLEFDSGAASTGILEFKVYDAGKSPKFPPVVKINRFIALKAAAKAPSPLLRKEFAVTKDVRRARVYISGIGWSELYLNGQKVSDRVLDPAATDYDKRVFYVTHDVTDQLKKGDNALGVMLGNGWYSEPGRLRYGYSPRVLLQLQIAYADGSTARVTSDPTWKTIDGPIRRNDFWHGEVYDARLERTGWSLPGYDDSKWTAASVKDAPGGFMQSQMMPAIKVNQTMKPVKLSVPKPGVYVYDLGQVFGGWARLRLRGAAGDTVTIKYSSYVHDNGLLDQSRYRGGGATDQYTFKADGEATYEPRFTYHPVRYVQVEGHSGKLAIDDLQGRVIFTDVDLSGRFDCSSPMLNQIHQNVRWTLTNGLFGMPLDCLYREHWAWTDPATITGSLYPRQHMPLFWTKWLEDLAHSQKPNGNIPQISPDYDANSAFDPAWGGNYPILVWYLYQYLDDERLLRQHYDGMKRIVDYHTSIAEDNIITQGIYGDHMLPGKFPGDEEFIARETPPRLIWTGYYYRGAAVISQAARLLGKTEDAKRYAELANRIKEAFNREWLNRETHQYGVGSQTANLLPLALRIIPQDQRAGVIENIVKSIATEYDGHLHTGNTGTTCMVDTLAAEGHGDLMYRVTTAKTYPGWGYMVDQGATTIWETWGGYAMAHGYPGAASMIMWGTIDEFFYNDLAGIRGPEYYGPTQMAPGFRQIEIRPHVVGGLTHARASVRTVQGLISSGWKKDGNALTLDVTIPTGARAKLSVPAIGLKNATITEGGTVVWKDGAYVKGVAGIAAGKQEVECYTFDVGSGQYQFTVK
ncbi:family 78 glycoside hydrolase catalytic domain [Candidatus Sumerlaeota bacterium]